MDAADGPFTDDFGPFDSHTWLDCAHQGPLPRAAAREVERAAGWKVRPDRLDDELFHDVPDRLKHSLARLVGTRAGQIVLGNSTSYGLHLLANGIDWREGDEILLVRGDFPATLLSWWHLREHGVRHRYVEPAGAGPSAVEVADRITSRTRLFCASWVNSFSGHALDLASIGEVCRERGVTFVVNGSQGVGSRRLDVAGLPVDALCCCGFKWLCGPYGTGFLWLRPELLEQLACRRTYWLAVQRGRSLDEMRQIAPPDDLGVARFDVFGTANFLNFVPWTASVDYLRRVGMGRVEAWNERLVEHLVSGLEAAGFPVISPRSGPHRSGLVLFNHPRPERNAGLHRRLRDAGIHMSLREGRLRAAPHLYNRIADIDRALDVLTRARRGS